MKKYLINVSILSTIAFFSFIFITHATTGGPYVVYDLRYDPITNLVYYLSADQGGRGCPPELKSLSLTSSQSTTIESCDDVNFETDISFNKHNQKINSFVEKMDFTKLVNLKTNGITVETSVVKITECTDNNFWECKVDFKATVFQNDVKKAEIPFSGCTVNQPLIIDGYSIPGNTDKLVLMFSRIGLCVEGGYTLESLHVVPDIKIIDTGNVSSYKMSSPLVPHEGSLFVYPGEKENPTTSSVDEVSNTEEESDDKNIYKTVSMILAGALLFGLGILLGRINKNKVIS